MGTMIYNMAKYVFGPGLGNNLWEWMDEILGSVTNVWNQSQSISQKLLTLAASLLIIYFFMDLTNQASKDMVSLDKLIVGFIRLIVAFAIVINLNDILSLVLRLSRALVEYLNFTAGADAAGGWTDSASELAEYKEYFNHITKIPHAIGALGGLAIPYIITLLSELMGKFIITSTAVMFVVRMIFSPIAVAQCFEDGTRSSGIRYLKGLFAEAISFSVILGIIYVATNLSNGGISFASSPEQLNDALELTSIIKVIVPKLVIAGGMASGSKIAHDIMGA